MIEGADGRSPKETKNTQTKQKMDRNKLKKKEKKKRRKKGGIDGRKKRVKKFSSLSGREVAEKDYPDDEKDVRKLFLPNERCIYGGFLGGNWLWCASPWSLTFYDDTRDECLCIKLISCFARSWGSVKTWNLLSSGYCISAKNPESIQTWRILIDRYYDVMSLQ